MINDQGQIFRTAEGDAWYRRNAAHLETKAPHDIAMRMIGILDNDLVCGVRSVCDVGCANGWRLDALGKTLPNASRLCGFDASDSAIMAGRGFPGLDLRPGLVEDSPFDEKFDLVIVSFVLHWIDRVKLTEAIARIDRLVANGGLLMVLDFLPDRPSKRPYHHLQNNEVFTYKQDYSRTFGELGTYQELARLTFVHDRPEAGVAPASAQERAICALLHKATDAYAAA